MDAKQVILMSHVGRPKNNEPNLKTDKIAAKLSELIGKPVKKIDNWGEKGMPTDQIVLLENLRFHKEEEKNNPEFAKKLASLADMYVSDAFGTVHRAHASTEGVAKYFDKAIAGYLIEKELKYLGQALAHPKRPFTAVLGGEAEAPLGVELPRTVRLEREVPERLVEAPAPAEEEAGEELELERHLPHPRRRQRSLQIDAQPEALALGAEPDRVGEREVALVQGVGYGDITQQHYRDLEIAFTGSLRSGPGDMSATGTFLASDGAAAITGQVLHVDGGRSIGSTVWSNVASPVLLAKSAMSKMTGSCALTGAAVRVKYNVAAASPTMSRSAPPPAART